MSKPHSLTITSTIEALRKQIKALKASSKTIALVPTMGALHEGHLSLIEFAKQKCDIVVCSIFVNPTQFGQNEDLSNYPRPLQDDIDALERTGAHIAFTPDVKEIYPEGFQTSVSVNQLSLGLCGGNRPGHFDGVATIVAKLLLMVLPDIAIFGEKDYQQLMVIRQMVKDLAMPIKIEGAPIVRDFDGLALSSRNAYLSEPERDKAPLIHDTLKECHAALVTGKDIKDVLLKGARRLEDAGFNVEYFELRHAQTLAPLNHLPKAGNGRLLVAAKLGTTRLIDNLAV